MTRRFEIVWRLLPLVVIGMMSLGGIKAQTITSTGFNGSNSSSIVGSGAAVQITTPGTTVVQPVTTGALGAGTWTVCGTVGYVTNGSGNTATGLQASINTGTSLLAITSPDQLYITGTVTIGASSRITYNLGCKVFAAGSTVNINASTASVSGGTISAYGVLYWFRNGS